MKIQQLDLTVRDLAAGCHDDGDDGVVGYNGKRGKIRSCNKKARQEKNVLD